MLSKQLRKIIILFVLFYSISCFAQTFDGTSFSSSNPFYGKPPYRFENCESYFISFRTDPAVIRALVPEPLVPISNGQLYILFYKHHVVSPVNLNYHEVLLSMPAALGMTFGGYIPVLYLDKVEGILPGRDIWGYNKVGGDIQFKEEENKVTVTVTSMDTLIIKATFLLGEPFEPEEQSESAMIFNLKYIPSVVKDAPPDVKQLTVSKLEDNQTSQIRLGEAELEFFGSKYNPFNRIPILEILQAGQTIDSFKMNHGEVLYDYLKKE